MGVTNMYEFDSCFLCATLCTLCVPLWFNKL